MVTSPFEFSSVHRAWLDCRRGKGNSLARWAFERNLERQLLDLADELQSRRYQPCPSVCFVCEQPKRREIFAAAFRDRVVHHLLVRHLEPWWERHFIHDTYACRRGKGTLAAVDRVQHFIRQASANDSVRAWALHLDIRSFFVQIDKAILLAQVENGLRREARPWAEDLIWLSRVIVQRDPTRDAQRIGTGFASIPPHKSLYSTANLTGLPIGNYSSQFFANVYLDRLDQYIKHSLKAHCYLRYVDDLLLVHRDPEQLASWEHAIETFLQHELRLELNPAARRLAPVSNGVDALGYIVWAHHKRLRARTVRRFEAVLRTARTAIVGKRHGRRRLLLRDGDLARLMAQCMSYRGLLLHADNTDYLRDIETRHAWVGRLWRLNSHDRVYRRDRPRGTPSSLASQWRGFKRVWPGAVVLMQMGSFWEAFRADAAWLREVLGSTGGRQRVRLGLGAGFPLKKRALFKYLMQQHDRDIVVVRETGRQAGAVRERAVSLVLEGGKRPASRWFAWARKPSSGKAPRRPRGRLRSDVAPASTD